MGERKKRKITASKFKGGKRNTLNATVHFSYCKGTKAISVDPEKESRGTPLFLALS